MRQCSNALSQFAVQTALGGYQSIYDLTKEGGRLYAQRNVAHTLITQIPGISCVKPKGALYMFPKVDIDKYAIKDDEKMILDLLLQKRVLPLLNHLVLET